MRQLAVSVYTMFVTTCMVTAVLPHHPFLWLYLYVQVLTNMSIPDACKPELVAQGAAMVLVPLVRTGRVTELVLFLVLTFERDDSYFKFVL